MLEHPAEYAIPCAHLPRRHLLYLTRRCSAAFKSRRPYVTELDSLRRDLLADPYFKNRPSLQPNHRKTAFAFHAKDDLPEVRREVYRLLIRHDLRFYAEVQSKLAKVQWVRNTNRTSKTYHYHENLMYDGLVTRLFKNRLHKEDAYQICFAKRGKADRTKALAQALEKARASFHKR